MTEENKAGDNGKEIGGIPSQDDNKKEQPQESKDLILTITLSEGKGISVIGPGDGKFYKD